MSIAIVPPETRTYEKTIAPVVEPSVFAALDLGTNNCRLMIAVPDGGGFRVQETFSRIVRLGEGLGHSNHLSDAAMDRTLAALKICTEKTMRRNTSMLRAVGTEACRRAENSAVFLHRAKTEAGLELEIISPEEEARLARTGCRPLFDYTHSHVLVFDIGGGSTELNWLRLSPEQEPLILGWISLPYGVVTVAERWGGTDASAQAYDKMRDEIIDVLRPFAIEHSISLALESGLVQLLGTSGTVTTLAGIHLGLKSYDRAQVDGLWMAERHVRATVDHLRGLNYKNLSALSCVGPARVDLILAGCAILEAIMTICKTPRLRIADRGLRDGIISELIERHGGHGL